MGSSASLIVRSNDGTGEGSVDGCDVGDYICPTNKCNGV